MNDGPWLTHVSYEDGRVVLEVSVGDAGDNFMRTQRIAVVIGFLDWNR